MWETIVCTQNGDLCYEDWQAIARWAPIHAAGRLNWGQWELFQQPRTLLRERHAARLRIALADWRREHGSLPESLDALVGPYFEKLPLGSADPAAFRLLIPRGLPYELTEPMPNAEPIMVLAKGTPFLWTPGGCILDAKSDEAEMLMRGTLLPIPPPNE